MTNHPNRSKRSPLRNPTPDQIRAMRDRAGLSQDAAGRLIHVTERAFRMYEAGDRRMPVGLWELLNLKILALKQIEKE